MEVEKDKKINKIFRPKTLLDHILNFSDARVAYYAKPTPIDKMLKKTVLLLVPDFVKPNHFTIFRFISIPFIIASFIAGYYLIGTIIFLFSAFSDTLDGATARTRNKITTWGTLFDPIADKLLITSTALIIVAKYANLKLAIAIVLIELMLALSSYFRFSGKVIPAKTVGKIKMVLECLGIIFILFYILFSAPVLLSIGVYLLYGAVFFGFLSLFVYRSI